jgi:hypothetical protein
MSTLRGRRRVGVFEDDDCGAEGGAVGGADVEAVGAELDLALAGVEEPAAGGAAGDVVDDGEHDGGAAVAGVVEAQARRARMPMSRVESRRSGWLLATV